MPLDSKINERKKASNLIIKKIDGVALNTKKAAKKLKQDIIEETLRVNENKRPYTASSLIAKSIDNKTKGIIRSAKTDFNDFLQDAERYLSRNYSIALTKRDLDALSRKQSLILDDVANNSYILAQDLKKILLGNLATGLSTKELVLGLQELYPAYERNAETILRTGLGRTFSDINVTKFQEVGFDWYIWAGPNDSLTREIPCKHFVGKKFPASQLSQLSSIRQSLWNCRHSIIPLSDEEAERYEEGNISEGF